jgi:hypothetical protein
LFLYLPFDYECISFVFMNSYSVLHLLVEEDSESCTLFLTGTADRYSSE